MQRMKNNASYKKRNRLSAKHSSPLRRKMGNRRRFDRGFFRGYALGQKAGISAFTVPFPVTSIIIPTYNQKSYLKQCVKSIQQHTDEPYEIIVIDNGSNDGTAEYLLSMTGKIRYKILNENLGFAGGVNQGLMMSCGETILILNNDTVVTKRWLTNMLSCLNSHPNIGLIGPMTNYISGDQRMQTDYHSMREMQKFAKLFNIPNPGRWRTTQRLTGLCILMKRDIFRRIGYFDEGFIIGNCEDDDYGFRVRLSGLDLVIAGDAFIHHYGSTSIKSLDSSLFKNIYERNQIYYGSKWGDTEPLRQEALSHWDGTPLRMNDFYPTHVAVKGPGPTVYWIENGQRHPIFANMGIQATRLAQVDLRNFPVGESCTHTEIQQKMEASSTGRLSDGSLLDGVIVKTDNGHKYQYKQGKFHRIANDGVLTAWFLNARPIFPVTETEKHNYPEGLPIIAPPLIKSNNV